MIHLTFQQKHGNISHPKKKKFQGLGIDPVFDESQALH